MDLCSPSFYCWFESGVLFFSFHKDMRYLFKYSITAVGFRSCIKQTNHTVQQLYTKLQIPLDMNVSLMVRVDSSHQIYRPGRLKHLIDPESIFFFFFLKKGFLYTPSGFNYKMFKVLHTY